MFEFIISLCLATNIEGKPVNPCWVAESPQLYRTKEQCETALLENQVRLYEQNQGEGVVPLLGGICGKVGAGS